jgi:hypothetical protein
MVNLKGKRILLVTGEVVTGTDLKTARIELEKQSGDPALIKLHHIQYARQLPNTPIFL